MTYSKRSLFQASILLVLLLVFVTPSFARLSVKVTASEVGDICSKTKNPSFCVAVLKSTPGTGTADLPGLTKITLDLARSNATNTQNLIKSLIPKATEPRLKESYTSCSEHYDGVLGDFDDADQDLKVSDPASLNIHTSAALDEAGNCEDELEGLGPDPSVVKGSLDLQSICSIVLVISNLLRQ
ncbi:Pectinesterase inhibitor [Melia azedarach]|uniref:Pectinesterase inhibitor n=1 Tax=Melia azedarach TaxID=155640 RepID=A0ACC1YG13_MELAZ|nr:Pectinesterase inhibitor [Melia azedarach]